MRYLSFIIILCAITIWGQSPHKGLNIDCSVCHKSTDWDVKNEEVDFEHSKQTRFPLIGVHKQTDCRSCHESLVFKEADKNCVSCHLDIHKGSTGKNCDECHTPQSWIVQDIQQIHNKSRFPLVGVHREADCGDCHRSFNELLFEPLETSCYSCHREEYHSTTSPNHTTAGFSTDCNECHSLSDRGWQATNFNHDFFPLIGGHANKTCSGCHGSSTTFTGLSNECYSCHRQDYEQVTAPNHLTGNFPKECTNCHTIQGWQPATFDHNNTTFPLTGAHINRDCSDCHSGGITTISKECISCHRNAYDASINPPHQNIGIGTDCASCHITTPGWEPATFAIHDQYFPLTGRHALIANDCNSCHSGNYITTPSTCIGCHQQNYISTTNPNHAAAGFSTECQTCHSTAGWTPATFNHDQQYFPIYSGKHRGEWNDCSDCHTNATNFSLFSCIDCHDHNKPDMDNEHIGISGYVYESSACFACHPTGEKEGAFNHGLTQFPLTGAHTTVNCSSCHTNGYSGTDNQCISCHNTAYTATTSPNHISVGISNNCVDCHSTGSWLPSTFSHSSSGFPLQGAHINVQCGSCHEGVTTGLNNTCISCHQSNYNTAANHLAQNYPSDCSMCHSAVSWTSTSFNHQNTSFPLTGAHVNTNCSSCHTIGFTGTTAICFDCHQSAYTAATSPNHLTVGITNNCSSCHTTTAWIPSTFSHDNNFPLTGAHITADCESCHQGVTTGLNGNCITCHQQNYNSAINHIAQNYPTECSICHSTTNWNSSSFNHQTTTFPLTGAHTTVNCSSCHEGGFAGTPTQCSSCHMQQYQSSNNPNHQSLGLSTNCVSCHTTNAGWAPASFANHNNFYPLIGAHSSIANNCSSCHNGNYINTPNECYGCHAANFNATINPGHLSAGFPTQCTMCHNQTGWAPSNFNHDLQYFPIYRGKHKDEWNTCSDCHTTQNNFSIFSCIHCHEHRQSEMNSKHQGISGYSWNSIACLSCHPDGEDRTLERTRSIR